MQLLQGECKQQQQNGDDNAVSILISKVQYQVNTVPQLWLCVSTKHRCYKHSVHLSWSSVVLHSVGSEGGRDRSLWAQQSL